MRVFISISDDLAHIHYIGEVMGWYDKRNLSPAVKRVFETLVREFQPGEKNFYDKGVNALIVRRMLKLDAPFPVGNLIVRSTMKPMGNR
jgi:hypothetical protein